MQQVLPAQTGLYRYHEWMVQEINDENQDVEPFQITVRVQVQLLLKIF